jgi:hypothetical protein
VKVHVTEEFAGIVEPTTSLLPESLQLVMLWFVPP